jgi:hypothetical protein
MGRPRLTPKIAYNLARRLQEASGETDPRLESVIAKDSFWALLYATDKHYSKIERGAYVSGLRPEVYVDNRDSIDASLGYREELEGIREVPVSDFNAAPKDLFYAADDLRRVQELAEIIKDSGWITPLIVVVDERGPYVLEGGHRLAALYTLGIKTFPALVVVGE